jgi:hypothetical protein
MATPPTHVTWLSNAELLLSGDFKLNAIPGHYLYYEMIETGVINLKGDSKVTLVSVR